MNPWAAQARREEDPQAAQRATGADGLFENVAGTLEGTSVMPARSLDRGGGSVIIFLQPPALGDHLYTSGKAVRGNLEFSILPKDTLACGIWEMGIELPTFWSGCPPEPQPPQS
ncbi:unnamed protein product [Pleuronectes platessa]|uniref:Uncharacterized protein n=1 Tax=Pleuronectes platessa TaxID=8262 RepID=A0A9N7UTU6_PLEPL|nr:unnamed protein product [Pleuronectes platessa]